MLRELHPWMKPGDFVYKTDVYSYYASINHNILIQQVKSIDWPCHLLKTVIAYCERTILRIGPSLHCKSGIPKGDSLSPVVGALYLTSLDHAMERWITRGDCFYARFQDDIILVSRKRRVLKRMRKEMFHILRELRLSLRPEKTFVGRSQKGFDLLGYYVTPKAQKKALETAKQRYAQRRPRVSARVISIAGKFGCMLDFLLEFHPSMQILCLSLIKSHHRVTMEIHRE